MPNEMYDFVAARSANGPVSEYIRGLIRTEQHRVEERAMLPARRLRTANESMLMGWVVGEIRQLARVIEEREW